MAAQGGGPVLPPEQVERIEVMRGPVAEHSTQAIAGTINIVLREGYRQKDIQLRAGDNVSGGLHSPNLSLALPGQHGKLSWLMNLNAMTGAATATAMCAKRTSTAA